MHTDAKVSSDVAKEAVIELHSLDVKPLSGETHIPSFPLPPKGGPRSRLWLELRLIACCPSLHPKS